MSGPYWSPGEPGEPAEHDRRQPREPGAETSPWATYEPPAPPSPYGGAPSPYGPGFPSPYQGQVQPYAQPYGSYGPYGAPYGVHPVSGVPYSDKSKSAAGLLQLLLPFVGVCGVGRLYAGHTTIGVLQLVLYWVSIPLIFVLVGIPMLVGVWLWTVIDGILILAGSDSRDGQGRLLR